MNSIEDRFESPYFAAIDLGSNSFHMLVVRINDSQIDVIDREKEMVQIARGLKSDGELDDTAKQRAIECLKRFSERLRDIPPSQIRAVGTKTLRSARNARTFLQEAEEALGAPIQIISGYEEARLVYAGFSNSITNDHSRRLVIDIGGGSTEFIIGMDYDPTLMESLGMGCVSFSEAFIFNQGVNSKSMKRAYLAACSRLEGIRKIYLKAGWDMAFGTSGTIKAIAELTADTDGGAVINKASLHNLYDQIAKNGDLPDGDVPKLRKDVLPAGIAVLKAIFDQFKIDSLHVANSTLKEGLVYDTIGRFSDHDSREETVTKLQQQYQIDTGHADRVAKTAVALWQQVQAPAIRAVSRTKILRWAAQLHEVGLSISHSGHHHHGYYILRHSDLAGFGRYEQYILAALVRSHRRKLSNQRFADMDQSTLQAFLPLLVCLRTAVLLNRRREDIEFVPRVTAKGNVFELHFDENWLSEHPLTLAGLEQERAYCAAMDVDFRFS